MATSSKVRFAMTPGEIVAIQAHPGWHDGREGFLFCRFDAVVDEARMLRAEITFDDDGDDDDNTNPDHAPSRYFDAELYLEANRPCSCCADPGSHWVTIDGHTILIEDKARLADLLATDPRELAVRYADVFATFQTEEAR